MNKFIRRIISYLVPIVLVFIGMEFVVRNIPNSYSYKENIIKTKGDSIETLILGSSHTYYGINPAVLGMNSFNFANVSQSIYYDYNLLANNIKYCPTLKNIIIPISYFSMSKKLNSGEENWRKYNYHHYMDCKTKIIPKYNIGYYSLLLSKSVFNEFRTGIKYLILDKDKLACSKYGWGTACKEGNDCDFVKSGKLASKRHENNSSDFNRNINLLNDIINLAKERNINVFMITTPTTKYYSDNLNPDKLYKIINKCINISNVNDNVFYINYLTDNRFSLKYFYDSDHLNNVGAVFFSEILKKDVVRLLLSKKRLKINKFSYKRSLVNGK